MNHGFTQDPQSLVKFEVEQYVNAFEGCLPVFIKPLFNLIAEYTSDVRSQFMVYSETDVRIDDVACGLDGYIYISRYNSTFDRNNRNNGITVLKPDGSLDQKWDRLWSYYRGYKLACGGTKDDGSYNIVVGLAELDHYGSFHNNTTCIQIRDQSGILLTEWNFNAFNFSIAINSSNIMYIQGLQGVMSIWKINEAKLIKQIDWTKFIEGLCAIDEIIWTSDQNLILRFLLKYKYGFRTALIDMDALLSLNDSSITTIGAQSAKKYIKYLNVSRSNKQITQDSDENLYTFSETDNGRVSIDVYDKDGILIGAVLNFDDSQPFFKKNDRFILTPTKILCAIDNTKTQLKMVHIS